MIKHIIHYLYALYPELSRVVYAVCINYYVAQQGRSQELEMGGAKLLGEGSGGRLRPPVGPGQSPGRGQGGRAPRKLLGFKHLIKKFPKKSKIKILLY